MKTHSLARQRFSTLIRHPDTQIALAEAALCIAWEDQGTGNPDEALQQLDAMAAAARPFIDGMTDPPQIVAALNRYLFEQEGFRGNTWNYDNPANSFLDCVLETRTGLPIALAVLYIEIGWRLGLPLAGLALPGHFLVCYPTSDTAIYIDPFHQGRLWSYDECAQQIATVYGSASPALMQTMMAPPTRRAILTRMLRNLKHSYLASTDLTRALSATDRILLLTPKDAAEIRDRGLLRLRLGQHHNALEDLERYKALAPDASDQQDIQKYVRLIAEHLAWNN
jgi:regulator of sirC expression with transglutaminase-like and TPR domain